MLLGEQETDKVDFNDFCRILSQALQGSVILASRKGKILGLKERKGIPVLPNLAKVTYGSYLEAALQERFLSILSTKENVNLLTLGLEPEVVEQYYGMIAPVNMGGRRLGTLFVYRTDGGFSIDDIILTEYGATVIGLAMQRAESEEMTEEYRKEQDVKAAVRTLSRLEAKAMACVLDELDEETEGILVTSRLADKVGITRSVIVNGLKKCESAGIIKTRSSGMKGTYIRIVNDLLSCDMIRSCIEEK